MVNIPCNMLFYYTFKRSLDYTHFHKPLYAYKSRLHGYLSRLNVIQEFSVHLLYGTTTKTLLLTLVIELVENKVSIFLFEFVGHDCP